MKVVISWIVIAITAMGCATQAKVEREPRQLLAQGRQVMQRGDPQRAITELFDPVIEHYEAIYKTSGKHVYSASNTTEMLIYLTLPNDDKLPIEVLDSVWAGAYLMKGYALVELKRFDDAQKVLNEAIILSPMNSQYLSELAYTYQVQKDCRKSIEIYMQAEEVVELGSDEATKNVDLSRAWRGQGYCLVEQGKLDEAEAMYRKCLALDSKDDKARGELEYIRRQRAN